MAQVISLQEESGVQASKKSSKRPADSLADSEGSTANKLKKERKRKCERLNKIRKEMGMKPISCN